MKLALWGADAEVVRWIEELTREPRPADVRLTWACDVGEALPALQRAAPELCHTDSWERLLNSHEVDAILVSDRPEQPGLDQLRQMLLADATLLVQVPLPWSVLSGYELEAIRSEAPGRLLPIPDLAQHPGVRALSDVLSDAKSPLLGPLEQIVLERTLPNRGKKDVLRHLARDAGLLRTVTGELTQVMAMAPGSPEATDEAKFAHLGVQLSGPGGVLVRWSVGPVETLAGAKIVCWGSQGRATLLIPENASWNLEAIANSAPEPALTVTGPPWQPLAEALAQRALPRSAEPAASPWMHAVRARDLAGAVETSLARRKLVELKFEEDEASAFKGTMTLLGCFALLAALPIFMIWVLTYSIPVLRYGLGLVLIGGLLGFLVLQLLRFVIPADADSQRARS